MKEQTKGILEMAGASVLFASGGLVLKYIDWNPLAINGMRCGFGTITLLLYFLIAKRKVRINKTVWFGAICYMGMTTLFVVANKLTSAGNAIVLQYTCPIWLILLNFLFFHKKPANYEKLTVICVLIGICMVFSSSLAQGNILGDCIAILSGLFYAFLFLMNSFEEGDAMSSVLIGQLLSFVCLSPAAFFSHVQWNLQSFLVLAWLGIFQVGAAYILFSLSTAIIPPLTASLISGFEPVLNPLLVALVYHETLTFLALAGAAVVIISVTAGTLYGTRLSEKQPEAKTTSAA